MARATMLLRLALAVLLSTTAASATTPQKATELALDIVENVSAYSRANPDAAGAFEPWAGDEPAILECAPFYSPGDRELLAYYVTLGGRERTFVLIDAREPRWLAYGRAPDLGGRESPGEAGRATHGDYISAPPPRLRHTARTDRFPDSYYIAGVPHYYQSWSNNCGPTAIEMVMDYWGPHVPQMEVTHVANNPPDGVNAGAANTDMLRSIHFSSISTAVADTSLHGYSVRGLGYAAASIDWAETAHFAHRYDDLKRLVSSGIPVLIKTRFAEGISAWHLRVVVGYDDNTDVFIVHDPWYAQPFSGPDVHFNQSYLLDTLWPWSGLMLGFLAMPWEVSVCVPNEVPPGGQFTLGVVATCPGPAPFRGQFDVTSSEATLGLPPDLSLAPGETATKPLNRISLTGTASAASWEVIAGPTPASSVVSVLARGLVTGSAISYGSYVDSIGARGSATVNTVSGATPPTRIRVDGDGLGDYETIQEGLAAASAGDTVVVAAGTYSGPHNRDLDLMGKTVLLTSESGVSMTVIDCESEGPGLRFDGGETPAARVEGVTILNGGAPGNFGGGIFCSAGSSPTVAGCALTDCAAPFLGGGIYCEDGSSPVLTGLVVTGCTSAVGSGLYCRDASDAQVSFCTFHGNSGSQVTVNNASPSIVNTIITGSPGGLPVTCVYGGAPSISHSLVYGNASGDSLCGSYSENIFTNPFYCDEGGLVLTLCDDSPCLPGGNPWGESIGALGAGGCGTSTGIVPGETLPGDLALRPKGPNPFSGATSLELHIPEPGGRIEVTVYSASGRRVCSLADREASPGVLNLVWGGRDDSGRHVPSGVYFVRLRCDGAVRTSKVALIR